jgi:hypothetical protein
MFLHQHRGDNLMQTAIANVFPPLAAPSARETDLASVAPIAPSVVAAGELSDEDLEHVVGGLERVMHDDDAARAWLDRRSATLT